MKAFIERIKSYYRKKGKWALFFDILFYSLIILFLIPATRKKIAPLFIKSTLHPPLNMHAPANNKVGEADYRWPLETPEGESFYLAQEEGKLIFLNFWATWCPPCIAEMPSIQRLYDQYKDRITFILVSSENPETVRNFLNMKGYTFPVYIQRTQSPSIFQTQSIPTTFIISQEGKILVKKKGAAKWDSKKVIKWLEKNID